MKPSNAFDRAALSLWVSAAIFTAAVYRRLPDPIATHFDLHGAPNGWMSRPVGAWLGVVLMALVWTMLRFGAALLPGEWGARMGASPMRFVSLLVVGFLVLVQGTILYAGLRAPPDVATLLALSLGAFWLVLGLVMPRVRRNPFVGIRTAWTLSSDENWARTHRHAGIGMVASGLVAMLGGLAGSLSVGVAAIVTSTLVAAAYSFVLARRLER